MRITLNQTPRGIALIVVMVAVFVLAVLVGAFAYHMKVEMQLARETNRESELIWAGRSGVELARWVLAQQMNCPYDGLDQKWAGGPGGECDTNGPLADLSLENFPVGSRTVSVKITDLESRINVNTADETVLQQALTVMGVDAGEIPAIVGSILDWIDADGVTRINGTESDYYESLAPAYFAKNRPMDDLTELLLVRGVTPPMYSSAYAAAAFQRTDRAGRVIEEPPYAAHLDEILTPLSSGKVNVNTASRTVLTVLFNGDEDLAAAVVAAREGGGAGYATPAGSPVFPRVEDLLVGSGFSFPQAQSAAQYLDKRSRTFDVQVTVSESNRKFHAIIGRNNPRDMQVLSFYWVD